MDMTRRKFLELVGAGNGGHFVSSVRPRLILDFLPRNWRCGGRLAREKRVSGVYLSGIHTDARLHLGGIGTLAGISEVGADGQLTSWQLWHNLREGLVPFAFAIKSGQSARLLQTAGGPDWPRVKTIEMTDEYPMATLRFVDDALPVAAELTAFSPFSPLDVDLSSLPAAIFNFRLRNTTRPAAGSFIGGDAGKSNRLLRDWPFPEGPAPRARGQCHRSFCGRPRRRVCFERAPWQLSLAGTGPSPFGVLQDVFVMPPDPHSGEKNYAAVSPRDLALPPLDRPEGLKVEVVNFQRFPATSLQTVIWLEDTPGDVPEQFLHWARDAVRAGATLAFSGSSMPLLAAHVGARDNGVARPDVVFNDFENGYVKWKVEGSAFGSAPARGGFSDQQPVTGFLGHGLVNSYLGGDGPTGKMTSETFTIERHFIRFLVGGGHWPGTQIRLVVDGRVERAAQAGTMSASNPPSGTCGTWRGAPPISKLLTQSPVGGAISMLTRSFFPIPSATQA